MSNIDKYGIERDFNHHSNTYVRYGNTYEVTDLIELSKNHDTFDLDLRGVDLSNKAWGANYNTASFIYHMVRVNKATLDHPIILDDEGYICDGWHRVAKSIIEGKDTIKAIRLTMMPEPIVK